MTAPSQTNTKTNVGPANWLFWCGVVAGPLFTLAYLVEGATRATYNPLRHPISSLAIGELGWMQTANFLVTGLLLLAFAVGLRRALRGKGGSTWGPVFIGIVAVGLLGAGLFVTDPMNGYPVGTPDLLLQYTLPGRLHRSLSALVFIGLPVACFIFARYFNRRGARNWAIYSVVTAVAFLAAFIIATLGFVQVGGLAAVAGLFQRLTLIIGFTWLTLLAVRMLRAPADAKQAMG